MTSGKGSRTAGKGCRLRTFRQQVQSRCCSLPREGSVAAAPLAVLPSPIRIASPPLRPSRGSPPPPQPRHTSLLQNLPNHSLPRASSPGRPSDFSAPRPDRACSLLPSHPRRSGPAARSPQPHPCLGPAHLHLFAEVARPRHCRRPGVAAATAGAPASRPRRGPGDWLSGCLPPLRPSVSPASLRCLSGTRAGCS